MVYVLVKNGVIENTIIAKPEFIEKIKDKYEACVCIDGMKLRPGIGWEYKNGKFKDPNQKIKIDVDET